MILIWREYSITNAGTDSAQTRKCVSAMAQHNAVANIYAADGIYMRITLEMTPFVVNVIKPGFVVAGCIKQCQESYVPRIC